MKQLLLSIGMLASMGLSSALVAHEGHAIVGEVVTVGADTFQVRTAKDTVMFKFSEKTTFELKKKPADSSGLKQGDRVSVTASKLGTGEMMATKVALGLRAPKPTTSTQKPAPPKRSGV
jgi:hypothetical protein